MKKIIQKPVDASGRNWLLPFNDMMTLLLTFFVLVLSLSRVDTSKIQTASFAVINAFGASQEITVRAASRVFDPFIFSSEDEGGDTTAGDKPIQEKPWGSIEDWKKFIQILNGMTGVRASLTEKGIEMNFSESLFYRTGESDPATADHPGFQQIIEALGKTDVMVRVEDHTADSPLDRSRYASNWELSTARAARVAEILVRKGIAPRRLSISGYGDSRMQVPGRLKSDTMSNRIDVILTFNQN